MRLGIGLYVIPLAMIANPALIGLADQPSAALLAFAKIALGLWALSFAFISDRALVWRASAGAAGLLVCFAPS